MLEDIKLILHFDFSLNLSYSAVCKYLFHNIIILGITEICFCDKVTWEKPDWV